MLLLQTFIFCSSNMYLLVNLHIIYYTHKYIIYICKWKLTANHQIVFISNVIYIRFSTFININSMLSSVNVKYRIFITCITYYLPTATLFFFHILYKYIDDLCLENSLVFPCYLNNYKYFC